MQLYYCSRKPQGCIEVQIWQSHRSLCEFLSKKQLTDADIGTTLNMNGTRLMVLSIDAKNVFLSTQTMAKTVASVKDECICIDVSRIHEKIKLGVIQTICKYCYTYNKYTTSQDKKHVAFYIKDSIRHRSTIEDYIKQIEAVNINRDFQNEPSNIVNPSTIANYITEMFVGHDYIQVKVFSVQELNKMGLNLIAQMGKGSIHKSKFIVIEYSPPKAKKTFCLVGKGVCYDAGGTNLKPGKYMTYEMKMDKTGATTVASVIKYASDSMMKSNIIGLLPIIENSLSGNSLNPGDIIKSMSGKTVEIQNTDAEGRVIMADALEYSGVSYSKIDYIFDLATLTGQAESFVPDISAVHFTTNKTLSKKLILLGEKVLERTFGLPPYEEYMKKTQSKIANVSNESEDYERQSTFMASMFLLNFVPKRLRNTYVHFDITNNVTNHLGNGNCTILIINFLQDLAKNK